MLNNVSIMGRLVAAPELKKTTNGTSVCSFRIASERDGAKAERTTDFFDVTAWTATAEFVSKWFNKGSLIAINGRLQQRSYTDRNGEKRNVVEIVADRVYFCEKKQTPSEDDLPFEMDDELIELDDEGLPF